ncbi:phage tail assembly chaperone [Streptomyces sp. Amel2xC10]|uniref:phage tail assembly chaperone n=1 Tax=Streptomyces sp. Amel2xC10 TaxID=1305826 RepID=UPI000A09124F|nr:phage tail assembly chaperone [Streptomyces sp. Amel2xC10]SMF86131.1 Phage tail assembly chaperone [Streptomyces sp. Amel2xC10]
MALSADAILGAEDTQTKPVDVPAWGGVVLVRGLTGIERDAYEASIQQIRPKPDGSKEVVLVRDNARAKLLVKCLVDEQGNRLFKDTDAPALGKKNGAILDRLYDVAAELSGMGDANEREIEGNSEAGQTGDSSSSSPETSDAPSASSSDGSAPES